MKKEIWKPVVGYKGLYEVSSYGRVRSLNRIVIDKNGRKMMLKGKILKAGVSSNGYFHLVLCRVGEQKSRTVHSLVAEAFLKHKPDGMNSLVVDHKDNDKLNNHVNNLQLITSRFNCSKDKKNKSSNYIGVSWYNRDSKWSADIYIDGKSKHIGRFDVEEDAAQAYQLALWSLEHEEQK